MPQDGAAYDPATRQWTPIPAPPVPDQYDAIPVATASDTLTVLFGRSGCGAVVGGHEPSPGPAGATYDPARGAWNPLPPLPEIFTCNPEGVRVGDVLYVWGGRADGRRQGFALGPAGTWAPVTPTPLSLVQDLVISAGKVYALSGGIGGAVDTGATSPTAQAAVFDPLTSVWTVLPDPPIVPTQGAFDLDGTLFLWDGQHAAVLTAATGWRRTPDLPLSARTSSARAAVGGRFVVWGGWEIPQGGLGDPGTFSPVTRLLSDGAAYDPATDGWTTLASGPLRARSAPGSAGSADQLFIWGGTDTDQSSVPQLDDGATVRVDR